MKSLYSLEIPKVGPLLVTKILSSSARVKENVLTEFFCRFHSYELKTAPASKAWLRQRKTSSREMFLSHSARAFHSQDKFARKQNARTRLSNFQSERLRESEWERDFFCTGEEHNVFIYSITSHSNSLPRLSAPRIISNQHVHTDVMCQPCDISYLARRRSRKASAVTESRVGWRIGCAEKCPWIIFPTAWACD